MRRIEGLMNEFGGYVSNANLYKGSYGGADLLRHADAARTGGVAGDNDGCARGDGAGHALAG